MYWDLTQPRNYKNQEQHLDSPQGVSKKSAICQHQMSWTQRGQSDWEDEQVSAVLAESRDVLRLGVHRWCSFQGNLVMSHQVTITVRVANCVSAQNICCPSMGCCALKEAFMCPICWYPLKEGMATHSSILPRESHRWRSLEGCSI